ncbi:hypothetical protein, partial [Nitrospira sp. BLG_2]|uniref:hypothetical protein n=1 Tax=Nitrospira sp. BLG_2 TaxID=3397507 RepID=UPI003B9C3059
MVQASYPSQDLGATRFFRGKIGVQRLNLVYNECMQALVKHTAGPGLTLTDWADPTPGPHDAVVKVAATSL